MPSEPGHRAVVAIVRLVCRGAEPTWLNGNARYCERQRQSVFQLSGERPRPRLADSLRIRSTIEAVWRYCVSFGRLGYLHVLRVSVTFRVGVVHFLNFAVS